MARVLELLVESPDSELAYNSDRIKVIMIFYDGIGRLFHFLVFVLSIVVLTDIIRITGC